ncbi:MAG: 2Fe-2S iron-sulfur cluster-binding protein [Mycobacterium sp.]
MPQVTFNSYNGQVRQIDGNAGDSVMQLAVRNGVPGIVGECGGVLSCATCHVFVDQDDFTKLEPISDLEAEMLEGAAEEPQECSRLACQITLSDEIGPLHVTTPEFQE